MCPPALTQIGGAATSAHGDAARETARVLEERAARRTHLEALRLHDGDDDDDDDHEHVHVPHV